MRRGCRHGHKLNSIAALLLRKTGKLQAPRWPGQDKKIIFHEDAISKSALFERLLAFSPVKGSSAACQVTTEDLLTWTDSAPLSSSEPAVCNCVTELFALWKLRTRQAGLPATPGFDSAPARALRRVFLALNSSSRCTKAQAPGVSIRACWSPRAREDGGLHS